MSAQEAAASSVGPLDGIRILDLTWMLSGPYCTMLLADLGADVIKVESPDGDPMRIVGPHLPDDDDKFFGGYFQSVNRSKRSIVLDLKSADGRRDLLDLAKSSDAVVENFRSGVMGSPWCWLRNVAGSESVARIRIAAWLR